jgi:hypothetical protein
MMQFFRRAFFASRITQWISPHGVHAAGLDMRDLVDSGHKKRELNTRAGSDLCQIKISDSP